MQTGIFRTLVLAAALAGCGHSGEVSQAATGLDRLVSGDTCSQPRDSVTSRPAGMTDKQLCAVVNAAKRFSSHQRHVSLVQPSAERLNVAVHEWRFRGPGGERVTPYWTIEFGATQDSPRIVVYMQATGEMSIRPGL
jgi:hypothetical protein